MSSDSDTKTSGFCPCQGPPAPPRRLARDAPAQGSRPALFPPARPRAHGASTGDPQHACGAVRTTHSVIRGKFLYFNSSRAQAC